MVDILARPIPGQSLTMPKGSGSWEHPPRFTDPSEALDYLFTTLTQKKKATELVLLLKAGSPCEAVARTVLMQGFTKGLWTPDLMLMMGATVMYMIAAIGKRAGVSNLKIKNDDPKHDKLLDKFLNITLKESTSQTDTQSQDTSGSLFTGLTK